ncbi:uncharacterized protein KLLA0_E19713g [Kluyveromyces lactis]|uniref:KLLA0E19713p n=1 Tax=Kluyveromyces lactis (strain ATCC 8585 / CBS 2359 / DSM 70799 / NBRC 1267 / NRRL Y-1140 / WM37) TaxID=284590 RepID=Q6CMJ6_KLULA|nr:uncharacterized protein KLLA0_E19713g [Kluyveromyces lactis]CAG99930.1 KLLA0E19713p [Kluyveromyces lactis]|eukprot:XP_454843.1 uncharacterized protein KLLA0_E19713g [Kluyveromyces lactis]
MMISKTIYRGSRVPAASRLFTNSPMARSIHNSNIDSKGIKETLEDVNKKVGKAAAEGIEKTEEATHHLGENFQNVEEKVKGIFNMTGQDAKEAADTASNKASDLAEKGKEHAQAKGREAAAKGKEAAAKGKEKLENAADKLNE